MKRIAVIDLGTNTFHLLITEAGEEVVPGNICRKTVPVKLGEGGINQGIIQPKAFQRGINALKDFRKLIDFHQVTHIKAVATAAIRNASNAADFISAVKAQCDIEIEMISGDLEARLIYNGVKHAVDLGDETYLLMDIGGGSIEFILCNSSDIFWKKSYKLGAAKMMDRFHHSDPISDADIRQLKNHLNETLTELESNGQKIKPRILVGSAGAFETFAELAQRRFRPDEPYINVPSRAINLEEFNEISAILMASTHDQRSEMPGLIELRVDMIVVATIITQYIIWKFNIQELYLSDYSLKEGVLFDLIS